MPKTCILLSASSQTVLQMAPPTQPNMKSSCFKMNQKSQDATDHETMNLWASKGLFTNQRVTSLRLRPSLYAVFFFWLVHPMYTEANSKFCCWRLKTKGLKRGTICHLSMQLYPFIIIYLQALLCMTEVKTLTPEMMEAFAEVIIQLLQSDCRSV